MKTGKIYRRRRSINQWWEDVGVTYAMLLPNFLLFLTFVIYPIVWTVRFMLYDYNGITQAEFTGIENFIRAMGDKDWWNAVLNTFKIGGLKLIIEMPLALTLAVVLNNRKLMIISLFISTLILFGASLIFKEKIKKGSPMCIGFGACCGIANGIVNLLVMMLTALIPTAILFPSISGGGIVLGFVLAVFAYKEKLSMLQVIGYFIGRYK